MIPAGSQCNFESSECLKSIGINGNYLNNLEEIYSAVGKCFGIVDTIGKGIWTKIQRVLESF